MKNTALRLGFSSLPQSLHGTGGSGISMMPLSHATVILFQSMCQNNEVSYNIIPTVSIITKLLCL